MSALKNQFIPGKIYKGISSYRGEGTGWGWVGVILRNECYRLGEVRTKKQKAKESVSHEDFDDWEQNWNGIDSIDECGGGPDYFMRVSLRDS